MNISKTFGRVVIATGLSVMFGSAATAATTTFDLDNLSFLESRTSQTAVFNSTDGESQVTLSAYQKRYTSYSGDNYDILNANLYVGDGYGIGVQGNGDGDHQIDNRYMVDFLVLDLGGPNWIPVSAEFNFLNYTRTKYYCKRWTWWGCKRYGTKTVGETNDDVYAYAFNLDEDLENTSNDDVYQAIVDSLLLTSEDSDVDLNPLDNSATFQFIAFSGENFTNY